MSNEKKMFVLGYMSGMILPSYQGIMINHIIRIPYYYPKGPFVCPKNPGFSRSIPMLFGWDWNPKIPIRSGGVGRILRETNSSPLKISPMKWDVVLHGPQSHQLGP